MKILSLYWTLLSHGANRYREREAILGCCSDRLSIHPQPLRNNSESPPDHGFLAGGPDGADVVTPIRIQGLSDLLDPERTRKLLAHWQGCVR